MIWFNSGFDGIMFNDVRNVSDHQRLHETAPFWHIYLGSLRQR